MCYAVWHTPGIERYAARQTFSRLPQGSLFQDHATPGLQEGSSNEVGRPQGHERERITHEKGSGEGRGWRGRSKHAF